MRSASVLIAGAIVGVGVRRLSWSRGLRNCRLLTSRTHDATPRQRYGEADHSSRDHFLSNGKTVFQSSFMLTTVQPRRVASVSASTSAPHGAPAS